MRVTEAVRSPEGALLPAPSQIPAEVLAAPGRWCPVVVFHGAFRLDATFYTNRESHDRAWIVARLWAFVWDILTRPLGSEDAIYWAVLDVDKVRADRAA